ncbi:MAG: septal ring lytic transglycosylase RlpA family protein [Bacteroidetes bacterium]|nr:septal ring lytic transglycosylase RlpA family protein [Fibrella sp.]
MNIIMSLMLLIGGTPPTEGPKGLTQTGKASFYAKKFTGRRTAYGERVSPTALEGAHRSLPLNTLIEVTNLRNHRSVIVRINDRGPFAKGRIVDLTYAAAKAIGMIQSGVATVTLRVVGDRGRLAAAPVISNEGQWLPAVN